MKVYLSILLFLSLSYSGICQQVSDSLINVLKSELLKRRIYDHEKELRINKVKRELAFTDPYNYRAQYSACDKIFDEYKDFKFDSAYVYAYKLIHISIHTHDLNKQYSSKIKLGSIQLSGGMFKETFETIQQLNVGLMTDSIKLNFYNLKSRALRDLALYNTDQFYAPTNLAESSSILDSAMLLTRPGSYENFKLKAELLILRGEKSASADIYRQLLFNYSLTAHQRAMAANDLSNLSTGTKRTELIAIAALYDIRSATKQTLAMYRLGRNLFAEGKLEDAELFLKGARDQEYFFGNQPRVREISAILTQVTAKWLIDSESRKNHALTFLIIVAVLALLGIACVSIVVYLKLKKVRIREFIVQEDYQKLGDINRKLCEDAHIKEEYIGFFFNIISGYILKIEKIKRHAERKLKSNKHEELLQFINEINIKEERQNLFHTFDKIFLKMFPNFIPVFNSLLSSKDQIWPKDNELLNTHLRIFALMRLGVKNSQTIANILETSISTIYTYKNRTKSRANAGGDSFEDQIMNVNFADFN